MEHFVENSLSLSALNEVNDWAPITYSMKEFRQIVKNVVLLSCILRILESLYFFFSLFNVCTNYNTTFVIKSFVLPRYNNRLE